MAKKDVFARVRAGFELYRQAVDLCLERGIKEGDSGCVHYALAMLRPDLCNIRVTAQGLSQPTTGRQFIEDHQIEPYVRPDRFTPRNAKRFRHTLKDKRVAGIIALVPCTHVGLPGPERGPVPLSEGIHSIAVQGLLRETDPKLARGLRGKFPKKVRSRLLLTTDRYPYTKRPIDIDYGPRLLKAMSRISGANAIVLAERGYRYTADKRELVPIPRSRR
ncbi:hypothetical protein KKD61_01925 [Patescibacteria group bacterium]|nr:hypothetical protein [Patescibacteria group bacterium]